MSDTLEEIHNNLWQHYVIDPETFEREISETARNSAIQLLSGKRIVSFQQGDNIFIAKAIEDYKGFKKVLRLVISNEQSRKIAGNSYLPFTVEAEMDNDLSALENYTAVFEAFLRHVSGAIQAEEIEE